MILDTAIAALRLLTAALTTLGTAGNRALERLTSLQSKSKFSTKAKLNKLCTKIGTQEETFSEKYWDHQLMKIAKAFTDQVAVSFDLSPHGGPRILIAGKFAFILGKNECFVHQPFTIKMYKRLPLDPVRWRLVEAVNTSNLVPKDINENSTLTSMFPAWKDSSGLSWSPAVESRTSEAATGAVLNKLYEKYIASITTGDIS